MTANIGALQAGWEESRVEEHLMKSLVQGKVAAPLPILSTSSLPNPQDSKLPEHTGRRCLVGWEGCSQASFADLPQAAKELLPGWRGSFAPSCLLPRAGWVGGCFVC